MFPLHHILRTSVSTEKEQKKHRPQGENRKAREGTQHLNYIADQMLIQCHRTCNEIWGD